MKIFTKESLIEELKVICNIGWVQSCKGPKNDGAVGNTVEQLLEIPENNLKLADAGDWEIKGQRRGQSLLTLFHLDPWPRGDGYFNKFLLPHYGWPLKDHPEEWSLRLTIGTVPPIDKTRDRGFRIILDEDVQRLALSFQANLIAAQQQIWRDTVEERIGLAEINPQPYWSFEELEKATSKLKNTFYILVEAKVIKDVGEYFWYDGITILEDFKFGAFIDLLKSGVLKVDFDARTGYNRHSHNHGTKFRIPRELLPKLYMRSETVLNQPIPRNELTKIKIDPTKVYIIGKTIVAKDIEKAIIEPNKTLMQKSKQKKVTGENDEPTQVPLL